MREVSVASEKKQKDMELFEKWRDTGDKKYFQKLYRGMRGYLNDAINRSAYGSNIPKAVFEIEAAQQMHDALKRYDPKKGAALQSHVYGAVNNKLKRVNYENQNIARRTERAKAGITQITLFQNEKAFLKEKLGREPSSQELADVMGWSVKQVETMLQEDRRDLSLNADLEDLNIFDDFAAEKDELAMHYYDMDPEEQNVFDHVWGAHGKEAILKKNGVDADWTNIARTTGIPEPQVQKIRKRLIRKADKWGQ